MGEIGLRALQQNAAEAVDRAERGETIIVTRHGRPVAQLSAAPTGRLDALVAAGLARPALTRLRDLPEPVRSQGPGLGDLVAEARVDERA